MSGENCSVNLDAPVVDVSIDTSGTRCPIPLLRAKQALKSMNDGQLLEVMATDPSAKDDFDAMLKHLPHELIEHQIQSEHPRLDRFLIQKKALPENSQ